jgi:uncharacterized membrane protein (UPF0127 family)
MPAGNAVAIVLARKTKFLFGSVVAVVLVIICASYVVWSGTKADTDIVKLKVADQTFDLLIADDTDERQIGLSNRESLPENQGMIFYFESPSKHCFWMKDTKIPLDIIWLNEKKKVVHVKYNAQPGSYPESYCPEDPASAVIELNAGRLTPDQIKVGQVFQY